MTQGNVDLFSVMQNLFLHYTGIILEKFDISFFKHNLYKL